MYQISFYVPEADLEIVKNAMFDVGAGKFDNYETMKPVLGKLRVLGNSSLLVTPTPQLVC